MSHFYRVEVFSAKGFSMEPFILEGDELIVGVSDQIQYAIGDIALYRSDHFDEPVAHRVVGIGRNRLQYYLRPDANPTINEVVSKDAMIGRVHYARRGKEVIRFAEGALTGSKNLAVTILLPYWFRFKRFAVTVLDPWLIRMQRQPGMRKVLQRYWGKCQVSVVPFPEDSLFRVVAKIKGQYAGSAAFEVRTVKGQKWVWISSLYVRRRYRGLGIASELLGAVESHANSCHFNSLWVSYEPGNRAAARLYEKLGYREAKEPDFLVPGDQCAVRKILLRNVTEEAAKNC
ncbi:MAG: GNAT family N-acetyltransferase [Candidatus Omnitrophica bacterium]|nr:GNAT family N-acetyltransferase [Candidatus Omnitrophota bacterium]